MVILQQSPTPAQSGETAPRLKRRPQAKKKCYANVPKIFAMPEPDLHVVLVDMTKQAFSCQLKSDKLFGIIWLVFKFFFIIKVVSTHLQKL